jgi:hypothetical protein
MKIGRATSATLPFVLEQVRTGPSLKGNPEWEAAKSSTRCLSPSVAVDECEYLANLYREKVPGMSKRVSLTDILRALQAKRIPFVLTGAHGFSVWTGRPRATRDVDLLLKHGRNYIRAVDVIRGIYPHLEVRRFGTVTAFFIPGQQESVIDVSYPLRPDNEVTLCTAIWARRGSLRYRIPDLEPALANKYGAMLALGRDPGKRAQDIIDFFYMVKHSSKGGRPINLKKLQALGEMVWPGGGGAEILRLVHEALAGNVPKLD